MKPQTNYRKATADRFGVTLHTARGSRRIHMGGRHTIPVEWEPTAGKADTFTPWANTGNSVLPANATLATIVLRS